MNTGKAIDTYLSDDEDIGNSAFGEETKRNWLIVIYNISGLADKSKKFASFFDGSTLI